MKKLFAIILVCAMLLGTATHIAAANVSSVVQPRYTYINQIRAGLQISNLGVACCDGTIITLTNNPVKLVIRLQELDGSDWMTIKKWEITGTGSITAYRDYAVYSGFTYRVHVTAYVYDAEGNVLESDTVSQYMDY